MEYNGVVYRPPIEANTFMLPVTEGCTYNECTYCTMYAGIGFRMVNLSAMEQFLQHNVAVNPLLATHLDRIYLVGGDPFALSRRRLDDVLDLIYRHLPNVKIVTMYASAANVAHKSDVDLIHLRERGINDLYIGVETGLDSALRRLNKETTTQETAVQMERLNAAGIRHRDLFMLGAAGKGLGVENALATAALENRTKPEMVMFTTMAAYPGSTLKKQVDSGEFELAGEKEILLEEKTFLENIDLPNTLLRAAHVLDTVPLRGLLTPENKEQMIAALDYAIARIDESQYNRNFDHASIG